MHPFLSGACQHLFCYEEASSGISGRICLKPPLWVPGQSLSDDATRGISQGVPKPFTFYIFSLNSFLYWSLLSLPKLDATDSMKWEIFVAISFYALFGGMFIFLLII